MAEANQLLLSALPKRGLFVLNVVSLESADALVETDLAVAAAIFDDELA